MSDIGQTFPEFNFKAEIVDVGLCSFYGSVVLGLNLGEGWNQEAKLATSIKFALRPASDKQFLSGLCHEYQVQ